MLCFSGFEQYSRWVPLNRLQVTRSKFIKHQLDTTRTLIGCAMFNDFMKYTKYSEVTSLFTSIFIRNTIAREPFSTKFYFPNGILALKIASNNSLAKTISKRARQPYSQVPGRFQVTGMMIEGFFWVCDLVAIFWPS